MSGVKRKGDDSEPPPAKRQKLADASAKPSLTVAHPEFASGKMQSGSGLKFHELSNKRFGSAQEHADYMRDTGLEPIDTRQTWGSLPEGTMYRSRRGSIGGAVTMDDGSVKTWRLHSLPTSEAIRNAKGGDSSAFEKAWEESATRLTQPAVNSRGKATTVNAILSDVTKIGYDTSSTKFVALEPTHAMGISGVGMHTSHTQEEKQQYYQPSIEVAHASGKVGTPSQTYHSEPMAWTGHHQHRSTPIQEDTGNIGMFASFPNQVCFNCGQMFAEKSGKRSVISGVPGVHFGGQKEGTMFDDKRRSTVSRAQPMQDLIGSSGNRSQIAKIHAHQ